MTSLILNVLCKTVKFIGGFFVSLLVNWHITHASTYLLHTFCILIQATATFAVNVLF